MSQPGMMPDLPLRKPVGETTQGEPGRPSSCDMATDIASFLALIGADSERVDAIAIRRALFAERENAKLRGELMAANARIRLSDGQNPNKELP